MCSGSLASRRAGNQGCRVQPAQCRPGQTGAARRPVADRRGHRHTSTRVLICQNELTRQIDQVLGQLRLGQVSAEGHASQRGEPEENDLDRVPTPPSAGTTHPPAAAVDGLLNQVELVGRELLGYPAYGHSPDPGRLEHGQHPSPGKMAVVPRRDGPGAADKLGGQRGSSAWPFRLAMPAGTTGRLPTPLRRRTPGRSIL